VPTAQKKSRPKRSFQISRQKDMRYCAATIRASQVHSFSLKRTWSNLISITLGQGNRELSIRGRSQNRPCHAAPFAKCAAVNFTTYKTTASPYCMYEMQIKTHLWSSYIRFNDRTNYYATADIFICHARLPVCGFHMLLQGNYQHKNVLSVLFLYRSYIDRQYHRLPEQRH